MVEKTLLRKIGMTDNESEVYLILLKMGEALASEIAAGTRISRPHVYDSINKLIEKGLASYVIKNNRKYFRGASPHKLLDYLKEKEAELKEKEAEVTAALPTLLKLHQPKEPKPIVEVYEGKEGMKTILDDVIKTCKDDPKAADLVGFGESITRGEELSPYAFKKYKAQRKRYKIKGRFLYTEGTEPLWAPYSEYRPLPKEYSSKSITFVYGNKTAIWMFVGNTPLIIRIESPLVSENYRNQFEMTWGQETKVLHGLDGVKEFLKDVVKTGKDSYYMGVSGEYEKHIPKELKEYFDGLRKKGIKEHLIVPLIGKALTHPDVSIVKYVPKEYFSPVDTAVYGNKVAIINWKKPITVIMMENADVADSFRKNFKMVWEQETRVFHGKEAAKNVLDDIIRTGKEPYFMSVAGGYEKHLPGEIKRYLDELEKKGLKEHIIVPKRDVVVPHKASMMKFVPREYFSPVDTIVYGSKIAIINWKGPISVIMMENADVADSFRKNFKMLWDQKTMVYSGLDSVFRFLHEMLEEIGKGGEYHVMGAGWGLQFGPGMMERFKKFQETRIRKGVKANLMFNYGARKHWENMKEYYKNADIRFVTGEGSQMGTPMSTFFYKDKVFIILWKREPTAFLIEDREVARYFESYYQMLASKKTETYEGLDQIFELFYSMLEELKPGEEYHVMGAGHGYSDIKRVQEEFIRFHRARQKKGVKVSLLFNDDVRKFVESRMAIEFKDASVKFTPPKMKTPMQIVFYKDKAFMILWNKEPPTAFLIDDKAVAQSFKDYYKMLDTIARP